MNLDSTHHPSSGEPVKSDSNLTSRISWAGLDKLKVEYGAKVFRLSMEIGDEKAEAAKSRWYHSYSRSFKLANLEAQLDDAFTWLDILNNEFPELPESSEGVRR
jgi:hypothetical protein